LAYLLRAVGAHFFDQPPKARSAFLLVAFCDETLRGFVHPFSALSRSETTEV
jgi:hypothetical protein